MDQATSPLSLDHWNDFRSLPETDDVFPASVFTRDSFKRCSKSTAKTFQLRKDSVTDFHMVLSQVSKHNCPGEEELQMTDITALR